MAGALVVKSGPLAGRRFEIEAEVVVGREDAAVTVDDPEISRRHALIRPSGGVLEIEDAGSRNGTFVNGAAVQGARALAAGDEITLGTTVFVVELARGVETAISPRMPAASQPGPSSLTARPAPAPAAAPSAAPAEPFGTYAAPAAAKAGRGRVASRTLLPAVLSIGVVAATAVTLVVYFAQH